MARNLVVFMDRSLIILNKPAGLIAQGGRHSLEPKTETLDHVLEDLTSSLSLKAKPYPVHRLDKLTTGVLILARNPQTAQTLSTQLRRPTSNGIIKTYLALVHRSFEPNHIGDVRKNLYIADGKVSVKEPVAVNYKEMASYTTWRSPILGDPIYGPIHSKCGPHLMLHSTRVDILRYLRKPVFGARTYRLGLTVPPPAEFLEMCENSGLAIAHEWTHSPVRFTINGSEIPFDHSLPLDEETVVDALRKSHMGK